MAVAVQAWPVSAVPSPPATVRVNVSVTVCMDSSMGVPRRNSPYHVPFGLRVLKIPVRLSRVRLMLPASTPDASSCRPAE